MVNHLMDDQLIDKYFNNIINEILPSLIISENKELDKEIKNIKDLFLHAKEEIKKMPKLDDGFSLGSESFNQELKKQTADIAKYISNKIKEPHFLYELSPTLNEVSTLVEKTSVFIVLKTYEQHTEKLNAQVRLMENPPKKSVFDGFKFLKDYFIPTEIQETGSKVKQEIWEDLAKDSLNKLLKDFDLKSITIIGNHSWTDIYTWSIDTYRAIKDSQENIGLSQKSAGINKTLNLCYSPHSLFYKNSHGSMLAQEYSNTITLTQQPYNMQKCTWQHEYTHVLDNRSSIEYFKEIGFYSNENVFMSLVEMSRTLCDTNLPLSKKEDIQQANIWTSEAMSMILNGKNTENFKNYQENAQNNFLAEVSQYLIISLLPQQEKTWLNLSPLDQKMILDNSAVKDFTHYISTTLYQKGGDFLSKSKTDNKDYNTFKEHIENISYLLASVIPLAPTTFREEATKVIEKNTLQFTNDIKAYLNKHSYSFDGNRTYFPSSDSGKYASSEAILNSKNYWIMPIEILARASENLQQPLLIGTSNFHEKNESYASNQLVPQLNKEERIILINSIQSMAKSIGLEVIKSPEDVKAVEKELNNIEEAHFENIPLESLKSYSTASGDEATAKILLNVAKLRASTCGSLKNKP